MKIHHEKKKLEMFSKTVVWEKGYKPFHWHENLELVQALDKPFGVMIDGVWYDINKGDILVVNEQIIHSFRIDYDDTSVRLVQFPLRIVLDDRPAATAVKPVITAEELAKDEKLSFQLNSLWGILELEPTVVVGEKKPFLQNMLTGLYFLLLDRFPVPELTAEVKKERQEFFRIVQFVNEHFTEDITVQTISKSLYMDRGKLSRIFSKRVDMRLSVYISTLRLNRVKQLMADGLSVSEAVLESGFQSLRTYYDTYKRIMKE